MNNTTTSASDTGWPCRICVMLLRLCGALALFALFGLATRAAASNGESTLDAGSGTVWLLPGDGSHIAAMQLETDVDIDVSGLIARTEVRQRFRNQSSLWVEGRYVFPLPENAAVDRYRLHIGERVIEGQLRERTAARQTYERARSAGKRAGMIEQQRPNVFTSTLANIAPGEEITVVFEYQQTLAYEDGIYRLRFPMVVGQRYLASDGRHDALTGTITDVATTMADPGEVVNPTWIHVSLDAGVPLVKLNSSWHDVDIRQTSEHRYSIAVGSDRIASDRDFELSWVPELSSEPQAAVFRQPSDDGHYVLMMLYPPDMQALGQVRSPRDVMYVLDVSGSMDGTSIEQAKAALDRSLERLSPEDRFNVVWFNDSAKRLYPRMQFATYDAVQYARLFVSRLHSGGGTEMLPALRLALSEQPDRVRVRQVVFITDGAVDNETALFGYIRDNLGDSRLFTVGIGSAPNAWFMKKAAAHGRGSHTFIGDISEVAEKTERLFRKLENPALVDVRLAIQGQDIEAYPDPLPDLYAGEPLSVLLRASRLEDEIVVSGRYGDTDWQRSVSLLQGITHPGVRVAWAREKIASLMGQLHDAGTQGARDRLRASVIDTALTHHLVSRFTSMVAVDVTPVNTTGTLYRDTMKTPLPHGWTHTGGEGATMMLAQLNMPRTSAGWSFHLLAGMLLLCVPLLVSLWRRV